QYFKNSTDRMSSLQKDLVNIQGKLATGQNVLKPSDDPLAMATALGAKDQIKQIDAFQSNLNTLNNQLSQMDVALDAASEVVQGLRDAIFSAGNSTLSDADRATLAQDIQARMDELRAVANRKDADGNYLFSGTRQNVVPFDIAGGVVQPYGGGAEGRAIQVSSGRSINLSITGQDAFVDPATGKSLFTSVEDALADLASGDLTTLRTRVAELEGGFDAVLLARTKVGLRQREAETIEQINFAASTELERVASEAVGLDYAKAISDLAQGQLKLQATQQSFSNISQLSLFNFIG
ncbi:MAG: flagellar hook-associated protein FlgL, partial [Limnobacter sp.]|nr:flagellar hook-associated protein FlgL [Limnobacter sp.]